MVTNKIKELQALQAKAATLQAAIDVERDKALATLHTNFGFESVAEFVQAVHKAVGTKSSGRTAKKKVAGKTKPAARATVSKGKRSRAKITPAIKAKVKTAVQAGTSGAAIAKSLGISLPSVHNIKKELGLVKARKPKK